MEVEKFSRLYEDQKSKLLRCQMEIQGYKNEKEKLQKELMLSNEKFTDTVSEIENAK